jgi:hypothetical protein
MGIHANNDLPLRDSDCGVQACRLNSRRIIYDPNFRVSTRDRLEELSRSIVGHTVCNDDLELFGGSLLAQDVTQSLLDRCDFV